MLARNTLCVGHIESKYTFFYKNINIDLFGSGSSLEMGYIILNLLKHVD